MGLFRRVASWVQLCFSQWLHRSLSLRTSETRLHIVRIDRETTGVSVGAVRPFSGPEANRLQVHLLGKPLKILSERDWVKAERKSISRRFARASPGQINRLTRLLEDDLCESSYEVLRRGEWKR